MLSVASRNVLVKILGEVRERYGFALVGYVVMPGHIHLPWSNFSFCSKLKTGLDPYRPCHLS